MSFARITIDPNQMALHALVDGKPVPLAETKSLGCTIKFYPES